MDILVSELLGSFGDNELSPECLDGVEHVLKGFFFVFFIFPLKVLPYCCVLKNNIKFLVLEVNSQTAYSLNCSVTADGISIPCEYTAYAAPILSERLHCAVANIRSDLKRKLLDWFQIPFVVNANNYYMISSVSFSHFSHHSTHDT